MNATETPADVREIEALLSTRKVPGPLRRHLAAHSAGRTLSPQRRSAAIATLQGCPELPERPTAPAPTPEPPADEVAAEPLDVDAPNPDDDPRPEQPAEPKGKPKAKSRARRAS